jgi:hypothetical protein
MQQDALMLDLMLRMCLNPPLLLPLLLLQAAFNPSLQQYAALPDCQTEALHVQRTQLQLWRVGRNRVGGCARHARHVCASTPC